MPTKATQNESAPSFDERCDANKARLVAMQTIGNVDGKSLPPWASTQWTASDLAAVRDWSVCFAHLSTAHKNVDRLERARVIMETAAVDINGDPLGIGHGSLLCVMDQLGSISKELSLSQSDLRILCGVKGQHKAIGFWGEFKAPIKLAKDRELQARKDARRAKKAAASLSDITVAGVSGLAAQFSKAQLKAIQAQLAAALKAVG